MARSYPALFGRFIAGLLLAVVALQATPAQPLSGTVDRGPAFSASSVEVALAPRRDIARELRAVPVPLPPRPAMLALPAAVDMLPQPVWPANRATGPPPTPRERTFVSPREPPLS